MPVIAPAQVSELLVSGPHLVELLRDILARGRGVKFRARGYSMSPFIKDGDILTVSPLRARRPGFGDVLVFTHPQTGMLVVHRVVGVRSGSCLARGDSNWEVDGWVPDKNILGRVIAIERNGRPKTLGLGPERFLLALLTRTGVFRYVVQPAWWVIRTLGRR